MSVIKLRVSGSPHISLRVTSVPRIVYNITATESLESLRNDIGLNKAGSAAEMAVYPGDYNGQVWINTDENTAYFWNETTKAWI